MQDLTLKWWMRSHRNFRHERLPAVKHTLLYTSSSISLRCSILNSAIITNSAESPAYDVRKLDVSTRIGVGHKGDGAEFIIHGQIRLTSFEKRPALQVSIHRESQMFERVRTETQQLCKLLSPLLLFRTFRVKVPNKLLDLNATSLPSSYPLLLFMYLRVDESIS